MNKVKRKGRIQSCASYKVKIKKILFVGMRIKDTWVVKGNQKREIKKKKVI